MRDDSHGISDTPMVMVVQEKRATLLASRLETIKRGIRIASQTLPAAIMVAKTEEHVLAALPRRLGEDHLAELLGVSLRILRRAFLDQYGTTLYTALYSLRLDEARRRLDENNNLSAAIVARQCGFGHYARFHHDFTVRFGRAP
ncbi:MAG: helix-turn-helix domain-containing protein [Parvibaculaceae bacterium]|nr:helix-turn-helix domain-containing protein [Parvibaculaceae bacterium]